jgi:hypothetical protein
MISMPYWNSCNSFRHFRKPLSHIPASERWNPGERWYSQGRRSCRRADEFYATYPCIREALQAVHRHVELECGSESPG